MKTTTICSTLIAALLTVGTADAQSDDRSWQLEKIFDPTPQDLAHEAHGRVFIYDGLRDTDIEQALESEFGRVGSMMFVRTVITDRSGDPLRDETSGDYVTEDDDCD
jgi:hypothetical protein